MTQGWYVVPTIRLIDVAQNMNIDAVAAILASGPRYVDWFLRLFVGDPV